MKHPDSNGRDLERTLDPKTTSTQGPAAAAAGAPCVDIVFHPDLRRVGGSLRLAPSGADDPMTIIGRSAPSFHGEGDAAPLGDPCISRDQLEVRYSEPRGTFEVRKGADARRAVEVLDGSGASLGELSASPRVVPPGSYLAIGDRVLLRLSRRVPSPSTLGMVGISDAIARVRRMIDVVAEMPGSVLVTGETGTGKELVARAIHLRSGRGDRPFLAVNCAALAETLVEAELFGHARSAFSGAHETRPGLLRAAGNGTVLLDEIGELSLPVQAKLLRTLEERTVRPVGSDAELPVAARFLFATHRELLSMVESGQFRADLYGRIEAPHLEVPPLRDRPEDVLLLFARFLCDHPRAAALGLVKEASSASPPVPLRHVQALFAQRWPRNVRSLKHHVDQVVFYTALNGRFAAPPLVTTAASVERAAARPASAGAAPDPPADEMARRVRDALDVNDYNQERTANALGIARSTLNRWMATLGLRNGASLDGTEIRAALASTSSVRQAARVLRVSERALRLRMTDLRIKP